MLGVLRTVDAAAPHVRSAVRANRRDPRATRTRDFSPWTSLLFFIPALAAQRLFGMYQQQRQLAEDLKRANMSFAEALVATLEKSDQYTAGHSKAVAIYSRDIAERMGSVRGHSGADVPLRSRPRHRQDRASREPAVEGRAVDSRGTAAHARASGDRRGNLEEGRPLRRCRGHRSASPRAGRRRGLSGQARRRRYSAASRIIAVADAYNAMTSNRAYRDAMPSRVARLRLAQAVESQFDTTAVAAFEAILAGATEDYRTATTSRLRAELRRRCSRPSSTRNVVAGSRISATPEQRIRRRCLTPSRSARRRRSRRR